MMSPLIGDVKIVNYEHYWLMMLIMSIAVGDVNYQPWMMSAISAIDSWCYDISLSSLVLSSFIAVGKIRLTTVASNSYC